MSASTPAVGLPDHATLRRALFDKTTEYVTARADLARTLAAEKQQWFEAIEEFDSSGASVAARKEAADAATVGLRIEALKLQGRVDGLREIVETLRVLVAHTPEGVSDGEPH